MVTSTIDTTTWVASLPAPYSRGTFYAVGRFWVFYKTSTTTWYYSSSLDGINWKSPTQLTSFKSNNIHWDGTYIHTYRSTYYRRGIPQSDGTIDWEDQVKYTVLGGGYGNITTDSEGYPCIIWSSNIAPIGYQPHVIRASSIDGTSWEEPLKLEAVRAYHNLILPLTNRKLYAIYDKVTGHELTGRYFDGESWSDPIAIATHYQGFTYSGVTIGDTIYLVYLDINGRNYLKTWTPSSGWSDAEEVNDTYTSTNGFPTLSKFGTRTICVIWTYQDKVLYRKKRVDLGNWEDIVEWITEPVNIDQTDYCSNYEAYDGKVSFIWLDSNSPMNIRHNWIQYFPDSHAHEIIDGDKTGVENTLKNYLAGKDPHSLIVLGFWYDGANYHVLVKFRGDFYVDG